MMTGMVEETEIETGTADAIVAGGMMTVEEVVAEVAVTTTAMYRQVLVRTAGRVVPRHLSRPCLHRLYLQVLPMDPAATSP